jgi:hypothetical protein
VRALLHKYNSAERISYVYIAILLSLVTEDSWSSVINLVIERTPRLLTLVIYLPTGPLS